MARISGILHLVEQVSHHWDQCEEELEQRLSQREREPRFSLQVREISADTMRAAIQVAVYLTKHALAAFALMGQASSSSVTQLADAQYILDTIRAGGLTTVCKRDLYKNNRSRFRRAEDVEPGIELLIDRHILREAVDEPKPGGGRPSVRYLVNPAVLRPVQTAGP